MRHYIKYDGSNFILSSEEDSKNQPPSSCLMIECSECGLLKPVSDKINFNGVYIKIPDHFFKCVDNIL